MSTRARWLAAVCAGMLLATATPAAGAGVDGISDQGLPAWDGTFAASPLAAVLRNRLTGGATAQIRFARYVLQWNALQEPSRGADPHGDYRERFEAWLGDVRQLGLTPVLALTSYDGSHPATAGEYASGLLASLHAALAQGLAIPYVEPWNEPNNQGRESAAEAAAQADAANALCREQGCQVIAGDLEDAPGFVAYAHAYEAALTFQPVAWGVHPYVALARRRARDLLAFRAALPAGGRGQQLWVTEIAAFYCRHGEVRGERAQAAEAAYLRDRLLGDPALGIAHAFYYGLLGADGRPVPCGPGGGEDGELYAAGDRPRVAAALLLPEIASEAADLFGPGPFGAAGVAGP